MKLIFECLVYVFITVFCFSSIFFNHLDVKIAPEHKGVDKAFVSYVEEYKRLAKINGVTFKKDVTIGFSSLKGEDKKGSKEHIVGLTTYGAGWREIDIDELYWKKTSEIKHFTLLMHELTHAYCDRNHDFGNGTLYVDPKTGKPSKESYKGHYKDKLKCPTSVMFPLVLEDDCVIMHYDDYVKEMFNRCKPY